LTATNSRPTHELIEAVARNMRRTIYVTQLKFDFVGRLAASIDRNFAKKRCAKQVAI
jgi:hypothetical protein